MSINAKMHVWTYVMTIDRLRYKSYHIKKQICGSHSNRSSPRFASIPSIEPESARSPIYARSRSPVARTSKYNNTIHHTCIHCIPPIHFVNNPQTSTTPTIFKGKTVGLTHHTLYETHRNLLLSGILIPPIHFVNNPQTSTTPTILKGQTVGLTHHTLYETHPLPWHLGWKQNSTHSLRKPLSDISRTYHIKEPNCRSHSPHALWNPP